ncbi:MAG: NAD(P)H-hydrate dehydratase [Candidatus Kapaibacterium sp.]|nr:MAG: NAD(P)H-hydrate dehydratase [Candidatus Kapabacteria bacterium]
MQHILSPDSMRQADAYAIHKLGIPAAILMENAARSAFQIIQRRLDEFWGNRSGTRQILVLAGSGNNGGDGFVIARHFFHCPDVRVRVAWIGAKEKMSAETLANFYALEKHGIPLQFLASEEDARALTLEADCIIDALIGTSGSENLRGLVLVLLERLANEFSDEFSPKTNLRIAIDVPTGLNALTGKAHKYCFQADCTITMAALKTGLLLNDGRRVCGELTIVPIGIPEAYIANTAQIHALELSDIRTFLPHRSNYHQTNKRSYGQVGVIGGSAQMHGAPTLTANASIYAGAGLVRLYSPTTMPHAALAPEIMHTPLHATEAGGISLAALPLIQKAAEVNDVLVCGMGLGTEEESLECMRRLIATLPAKTALVLDADALRALRLPNGDIINLPANAHKNVICTPHHGEFARLTGLPREDIAENAAVLAAEWSSRLGCTILLKNVPTIVSGVFFDENEVATPHQYWNLNGNAGMATAGSGDVLAGVIAALLAQGVEGLRAAALGAFLHAAAGDICAEQFSPEGVTASGIIACLPKVFPQKS